MTTRYGRANNPYMKEAYDSNQPHELYNLSRFGNMQPLPTHGLEWMDKDELKSWKDVPCILEVDLEFLRELHNDYPLAPELIRQTKQKRGFPIFMATLNTSYITKH